MTFVIMNVRLDAIAVFLSLVPMTSHLILVFKEKESKEKPKRPEKLLINENEMDTFPARWLHKIYAGQSFHIRKQKTTLR